MAALPIFALAVAVVEPPFQAPLMPVVGTAALLTPHLFTTAQAAIPMTAITGWADEKYRMTPAACPLPESRCILSRRHASSQAGLDKDTSFVAG
jgi:hypothetical protein